MSPRSATRYRKFAWLTRRTLARLALVAAQTDEYAAAFRLAGARNVIVSGNLKYDGAAWDPDNPRTQALRPLFAIRSDELIWVAGSTQSPEEDIILTTYRRLIEHHGNLRLILVPRQKDQFEVVAKLLAQSRLPFLRRSEIGDKFTLSPL